MEHGRHTDKAKKVAAIHYCLLFSYPCFVRVPSVANVFWLTDVKAVDMAGFIEFAFCYSRKWLESSPMRDPIANLVHSVLDHGLQVHDRLEAGANVSLHEEQAALKKLLLTDPVFGGGLAHEIASAGNGAIPSTDEATVYRVRYLLTCWLDELFIHSSPWADTWPKQKLEAAIYNTSDGAWKFWQYANQAEADADADALEVCRLCVLLGFRGKHAGQSEWVRGWLTSAARNAPGTGALGSACGAGAADLCAAPDGPRTLAAHDSGQRHDRGGACPLRGAAAGTAFLTGVTLMNGFIAVKKALRGLRSSCCLYRRQAHHRFWPMAPVGLCTSWELWPSQRAWPMPIGRLICQRRCILLGPHYMPIGYR